MIDITKQYKTKDGREVRIYSTDGGGNYPVHGAILISEKWVQAGWTEKGGHTSHGWATALIEINPYEDLKIDDPILVWDYEKPEHKERRHFAGVNSDGKPLSWADGKTSFTTGVKTCWNFCEKYDAQPTHNKT